MTKPLDIEKLFAYNCIPFSDRLYQLKKFRSVAQSGSAPGLGPGGRRFESFHSDHLDI